MVTKMALETKTTGVPQPWIWKLGDGGVSHSLKWQTLGRGKAISKDLDGETAHNLTAETS